MEETLKRIKECETDQDLEKLTKELIDRFTKESLERNGDNDTIGATVGINPCEDAMNNTNIIYSLNSWVGYIPKGMRIVYGSYTDMSNCCYTKGSYYYMDDESYVYEFVKDLKDKEVDGVDDLVLYIHRFLRSFLDKNISYPNRDDIHKLLYRSDNRNFYKPVKEHSIRDFYHNGSAMCTEYSSMASNLISIFNFDVIMIMDKDHAYNIMVDDNGTGLLVDFSNIVFVKDLYGRIETTVPFYEEIVGFNTELASQIIYNKKRLKYEDYNLVHINDSLFVKPTGLTRAFGIDREDAEVKQMIYTLKK